MLVRDGIVMGALALVWSGLALAGEGGDSVKGFSVEGRKVTIAQGTYQTADGPVKVAATTTLEVPAAPVQRAENEALKLSKSEPSGWGVGTPLRAINVLDVNAANALDGDSLEIRKAPGGELLQKGKDYLLSAEFGMVGLAPGSPVSPEDTVYATYAYALTRVDSVFVDKDGKPFLVEGKGHLSIPCPPECPKGAKALLNVYTRARAAALTPTDLFPVLEKPAQAKTETLRGRVPKTLAKLKKGEPVRIVCWGDSVTAGGNASKPETRYVDQFASRLKAAFPKSAITVDNVSVGGSCSAQWLRLPPCQDFPKGIDPNWAKGIDFERVVAAKPDLVTIEFVNDAGLKPEHWAACYAEILKRMRALNAEVILITPHFVMLPMMGTTDLHTPETRGYVKFLHELAAKERLGLADAASRWAHLWKEGIPYPTLLHNTINHPDDRGHALFADELMRCFAGNGA